MKIPSVTALTASDPLTPTPSDDFGRSSQTLVCKVVVRRGNEERQAVASGETSMPSLRRWS
ncbi:hypothetical protein [Polaromonas sp. YR568]|uniref:hypothetical protein n=1 Tax=Polaromonas sp. YR568 TaxID=1855301 RepID=UPI003137A835